VSPIMRSAATEKRTMLCSHPMSAAVLASVNINSQWHGQRKGVHILMPQNAVIKYPVAIIKPSRANKAPVNRVKT